MDYFVHKTAEVSKQAKIGKGTKIWNQAQVRENTIIGENCIIGKNVYIDEGVKIGSNCKIQNNCSLYRGTIIENGVFIGPHVVTTNDKFPRAINEDGTLKNDDDWKVGIVRIKEGVSIGACSVILPGITIGRHAMVGAGSVVTKDIMNNLVVFGNPLKIYGKISSEGKLIKRI